jgi:predicted class III extradiol MEMO1 family dioxygenase
MDILALPAASGTAAKAHSEFASYLSRTKNTICGRHPIGVLLGSLAELERSQGIVSELQWVRYEQSSACETVKDSSVSYASAVIKF